MEKVVLRFVVLFYWMRMNGLAECKLTHSFVWVVYFVCSMVKSTDYKEPTRWPMFRYQFLWAYRIFAVMVNEKKTHTRHVHNPRIIAIQIYWRIYRLLAHTKWHAKYRWHTKDYLHYIKTQQPQKWTEKHINLFAISSHDRFRTLR